VLPEIPGYGQAHDPPMNHTSERYKIMKGDGGKKAIKKTRRCGGGRDWAIRGTK